MTNVLQAERYVRSVLAAHTPTFTDIARARKTAVTMIPLLSQWAGPFSAGVTFSGSYAKGTAVLGSTDVDLFVSLHSRTPGTLADIYGYLDQYLKATGYLTQPRNVSIRVWPAGVATDVVVGVRQRPWD